MTSELKHATAQVNGFRMHFVEEMPEIVKEALLKFLRS